MLASIEGRVRKLWKLFASHAGEGILYSTRCRSVGTSAVGLLSRDDFLQLCK